MIQEKVNYYLDYCLNVRRMTTKSIDSKRHVLNRFSDFVGEKRLSEVTNEDFNLWIKSLVGKNIKANSINDYTQKLVAMFRFYLEMGEKLSIKIPLIPQLKGEPRRKNFYPKEVIDEVLRNTTNETAELMIRICYDTGMRLNELTCLKKSDFSGKKIHYMGKGRNWHDTWVRDETYQKLLRYCEDYGVQEFIFFEKNPSVHLAPQVVARYMKDAFKSCGYDDFHPHALRHSFAFNLQRQGASVIEIQHMIGHLHLKTTEEYLHGFEEDKMASLFEKYS